MAQTISDFVRWVRDKTIDTPDVVNYDLNGMIIGEYDDMPDPPFQIDHRKRVVYIFTRDVEIADEDIPEFFLDDD